MVEKGDCERKDRLRTVRPDRLNDSLDWRDGGGGSEPTAPVIELL